MKKGKYTPPTTLSAYKSPYRTVLDAARPRTAAARPGNQYRTVLDAARAKHARSRK